LVDAGQVSLVLEGEQGRENEVVDRRQGW
jgi:hypothetical protein